MTRERPTGPVARRERLVGGLTVRAAGLALALCALVVTLAVPLRGYLAQRDQIASLRAQERADRAAVADLRRRSAQWHDPAYVRAQARDRLHFVQPGETAYVVLGTPTPSPAAPPPASGGHPVRSTAAWYSQVWSTVLAAGVPAPSPKPSGK